MNPHTQIHTHTHEKERREGDESISRAIVVVCVGNPITEIDKGRLEA